MSVPGINQQNLTGINHQNLTGMKQSISSTGRNQQIVPGIINQQNNNFNLTL